MKSRISIAGCALATVLFSPPLSYSQSSPIVEYEKARVEFREIGRQFGLYDACFMLYRRMVESPNISASSRELIALKALYQSSGSAQNNFYEFLDRRSKALNLPHADMKELSQLLSENRDRSFSDAIDKINFLFETSEGRQEILLLCTDAKSAVESMGTP